MIWSTGKYYSLTVFPGYTQAEVAAAKMEMFNNLVRWSLNFWNVGQSV